MRTILAGFAGGILMFVWSSIAHVALPLGHIGVKALPHEASSISTIASAMGGEGGLFIFPDKPMANKKGSGPVGLLIFQPRGSYEMSPAQLATEFAKEVAEALIAAILLSMTALQSYGARLGFVSLVGLVVSIATNLPYWNWYAFPLSYTLSYGAIQLLGYVAAGLAIAWVVPTRST
jgi:hypothetical protein